MARLDEYRAHVTDVIQRHAGFHVKYRDVALEAIADHDHYQVIILAFHPPYKRPYTGFGIN